MKNIKKILFPVATIAASTALVSPLITSCGTTSNITEVARNYTPKIAKHIELGYADPDEMAEEYLEAIKSNPSILNEDFKFSSGQIYELVASLFESPVNGGGLPFVPELKVNSFKAGVSDISVNDKNQYTYKNGITTSLTAKIDLDLDEILSELLEKKITGLGDYQIVINANNLGFESKFTNFEKFNVTHASIINPSWYAGDYTLVQPVFPSDLTREIWAVDFKAFGNLNIIVNDVELISLENIDISYHFDYNNIALLYINVSDIIDLLDDDIYMIDVLQEIGSFSSYYLSDVTCVNRVKEIDDYVDVTYNSNGWQGIINFLKPADLDVSKCDMTHSNTSNISFGGLTEGETALECSSTVFIGSDSDITGSGIGYAIVKEVEDNEYVHEWKERHYVYPRFNQDVTYNAVSGVWSSPSYYIYRYGTLCKFDLSIVNTQEVQNIISANSQFYVTDSDSETPKYVYLYNPVITSTKDGKSTELVEGTDYSISDDGTKITFLKARDYNGEKLSITFTGYTYLTQPGTAVIVPAA